VDLTREQLTVYVCGITPYDTTHLGHAFTATSADILIRYLEHLGHAVRYVQNVTDIDDDILRRAEEVGEDWRALGDRWTARYIQDMKELNVRPPDVYPRATEAIPRIVDWVRRLIEAGLGYEAGGSVYYSADAWPGYGRLSRLTREEMLPIANERGNRPDDPHKRNPLDFVLWQARAPGEPAWPSPWGPGRPGWHIECSAMSTQHLGIPVDIHGGGHDLVFPHHESEIAQVEPLSDGRPFVRSWMHTAMVRYRGEKMSKSIGNLVLVSDLLRDHPLDALRLYLASHHYRTAWDFEAGDLERAAAAADRLRAAVTVRGGQEEALDASSAEAAFRTAMDDDLQSPPAVRALESLAEQIVAAAAEGRDVSAAQDRLRVMAGVLGLRLDRDGPEARVVEGWERHLERFLRPAEAARPAG
jgi:L-cysteine:1D-myo-inositol 2-amino-2-deoxy-alpha-D-glucopyranoside ligase